MGIYFVARGIIALHYGEKSRSLPLPFFEEPRLTRTSFILDSRLYDSFYYHSPDVAASKQQGRPTERTTASYEVSRTSNPPVLFVTEASAHE